MVQKQYNSSHQYQNENCPQWHSTLQDLKSKHSAFLRAYVECEQQKDFQPLRHKKDDLKTIIKQLKESIDRADPDRLAFRERLAQKIGAEFIGKFSEGFAIARFNNQEIYVDKTGRLIHLSSGIEPLGRFRNGRARVRIASEDFVMFNYLKPDGKLLMDRNVSNAHDFHDGRAIIFVNGGSIFIDTNCQQVIPQVYDFAYDFKDGVAVVQEKDKRTYQLIDTMGNVLLSGASAIIDVDEIIGHSKLRYVQNPDNTAMYVDLKGNILGGRKFQALGIFRSGVCAAKENGKWILIDQNGKNADPKKHEGLCLSPAMASDISAANPSSSRSYLYLISVKHGEVTEQFASELCFFNQKPDQIFEVSIKHQLFKKRLNQDEEMLVDGTGKVLNSTIFKSISDAGNGLTKVETLEGKYYLLNSEGQPVVDIAFDELYEEGEIHLAKKDEKYIFLNVNGQICDDHYDQAERFIDGAAKVIKVEDGIEQTYYIDRIGKIIFTK